MKNGHSIEEARKKRSELSDLFNEFSEVRKAAAQADTELSEEFNGVLDEMIDFMKTQISELKEQYGLDSSGQSNGNTGGEGAGGDSNE